MQFKQLLFTSISLVLATSGISKAELPETVSRIETATNHCAAEWKQLGDPEPAFWAAIPPDEIDPRIDAATGEAFRKYGVAKIALADYVTAFVGLSDPKNHNTAYLTQAQAKYNLVTCLTPTMSERELIIEMARKTTKVPDQEIHVILFEGIDKFECMQFAKASEVFFGWDLSDSSNPFDYKAITEANMKICDEK